MAPLDAAPADLSGALRQFGLEEHEEAIVDSGIGSLEVLLHAGDEQVEQVHELLEDEGAKRQARRDFRKWLTAQRKAQGDAAPPGSPSRHFYNFAARLNDSDISGVEPTIIMRIDIDPYTRDGNGKPKASIRMAAGAVERQVRAAVSGPIPVVSLVGPTGVGKSFVVSSFMEKDKENNSWPLVAEAGQTVPTSAHVSLYRGAAQPSPEERSHLLLLDLEGEDGRTPKSLEEGYLRRMASLVGLGFGEDELKTQLKATLAQRQHIVKEVLPPLAYLVSDVILFIDQVELRRTERVERVRSFAEQAHMAVESVAWRPALIIIQNKWARGAQEAPRYDMTSDYDWMVEELEHVFCKVTILRIPLVSDRHKFEDGLLALHTAVHEATQLVQDTRRSRASLNAESEFWFGLETLVEQFNERGITNAIAGFDNLSGALSRKLVNTDAAGNAVIAMQCLGRIPADVASFRARTQHVLEWYAYNLAGQARFQGNVKDTRDGLKDIYDRVMESLNHEEPCGAILTQGGKRYRCTQRRAGHECRHHHPAMVPKESSNFFKRMLLWKDWVPCAWEGEFVTAPGASATFESFTQKFDKYTEMKRDDFEVAFVGSSAAESLVHYKQRECLDGMCLLCCRPADNLTLLPDPVCHHYLCRHCILVRKRLARAEEEVVCPFCARKSTLPSRPEASRLRVLSLDGGLMRGLAQVRILRHLEERFAPLPVQSLFDLIVGTSAGGLISMALLASKPLEEVRLFFEALAAEVMDVTSVVKAYRHVTGQPMCCASDFQRLLEGLFGDGLLEHHRNTLPCCCCTVYNSTLSRTMCAGNLPDTLSRNFPSIWAGHLTTVARSSASAPTFVEAVPWTIPVFHYDASGKERMYRQTWNLWDGGIEATCPTKFAARIVEELHAGGGAVRESGMEMLVAIGSGRQPTPPNVASDNVFYWGQKLVDPAADAERQWIAALSEVPMLRETTKVRVNPPGLGAQPAFSSSSVAGIQKEMDAYFESPDGKDTMAELFALTFAKLWQVEGLSTLVAGHAPLEFKISLRDLRFNIGGLSTQQLIELVRARRPQASAGLANMKRAALVDLAKQALEQQPLAPAMPGRFVRIFDGQDHVLEEGGLAFPLAHREQGLPLLNVVWRMEALGDFPIDGFPRLVQVLEASQ